tara:strand:+ start:203 stop:850 length:648 start_codon:yes stop_codon:yes gene_type:complete
MGLRFKAIEPYLHNVDPGVWLEIGTDRGEGSTGWLIEQGQQHGMTRFVTIDMNPNNVQFSVNRTYLKIGDIPKNCEFVVSTGEKWLQDAKTDLFSMVYLDNFDWDYWIGRTEEGFVAPIRETYQTHMKCDMMNINSQVTHLQQAKLLLPRMNKNCIIVCDDTWYEKQDGIYNGKCGAVIPLLLSEGYHIIYSEGYKNDTGGSGVIMGKGDWINEN